MRYELINPDSKEIAHLFTYHELSVLSSYRNESHKFYVKTDYLFGRVGIRQEHYEELRRAGRDNEAYLDIEFGFRTLESGELAIVVWRLSDKASHDNVNRWFGHRLHTPQWVKEEEDRRFLLWRRRLSGDFTIAKERTLVGDLRRQLKQINEFCSTSFGKPLFKDDSCEGLVFPESQNIQRYCEAHQRLYGLIIDGISKDCLRNINQQRLCNIHVDNEKTVKTLCSLFPNLKASPFDEICNKMSHFRGESAHCATFPSQKYRAFEEFERDLEQCVQALRFLSSEMRQQTQN